MKTFLATVAIVALPMVASADSKNPTHSSHTHNEKDTKPVDTKEMDKLHIEDLTPGTGQEAAAGDQVTVHYTGTLSNGVCFDSSIPRGQPFRFTLGKGQVIQGWDQGLLGMKVGGKRKLTIPSHLGYGAQGAGASIPPHSTLIFEVELLEVHSNKK